MAEEEFTARARAYIGELAVSPPPRSSRGPGTAIDLGEASALAVGPNLVEFATISDPKLRTAIADALLLAQLAADKADAETPDQWFENHRSVLTNLGFVGEGLTRTAQDFSSVDTDLHEAILPVIAAAFAGAAIPGIVVQTLKQMASVDADRPWITLFERESQRFGARQFQISVVEGTPERPQVSMLGFVMDIARNNTQVLFLRHAADTVAVERIEGQFGAKSATLLELAPSLSKKLSAHRGAFLEALEI